MLTLKKLWPSLILLILYFVTDEYLSPVNGLICLGILGFGEFIYTRFRERYNDWTILLITGVLSIPGILALTSSPLPEYLQNGITEAAICILLGFYAFSHKDLRSALPTTLRKNFQINPAQQQAMKITVRMLFFLLFFHTSLLFFSICYADEKVVDFISGILLYLLIGLWIGILCIRRYFLLQKYRKEEWLPLVNEKGEVTGKAPRSLCHSGSKLLHPVVHLHILNEKNELFLQKRSRKKDLLPGMWDTAVGGHIGLNEKIEEALKREAQEELGITDFEARFNGSYIWESPRERELVFSFLCTRYNRIHIDNEEVESGRFWDPQEIEEGVSRDLFTPNFIHEYRTFLSPPLSKI